MANAFRAYCDLSIALHYNLFRNEQAQADSIVVQLSRPLHLAKLIEKERQLRLWDSEARVFDFDHESLRSLAEQSLYRNVAWAGKFERVFDQVDKDLE